MSRSRMLTLKTAAAAAAVLAAGAAAAVAAPGAAAFLAAVVPRAYGELRAWLTPPYLYFVINCIIISIAASCRFQTSSSDPAPPPVEIVAPPPPVFFVEETEQYVPEAVVYEAKEEVMIVPPETAAPPPEEEAGKPPPAESAEKQAAPAVAESAEEEFVISRSSWTPMRRESMEMPPLMAEKPMVSKRFGNPRRSPRPNPDGKALRVTRPKKGETLESTWKAITDGRAVPLARHLKKSDTWAETRGRQDDAGTAAPVRKSETFNDRGGRQTLSPALASPGGSGGVRLKREASLGQDDLNRRVEAFINKFNEEMRLQRQESCQQYLGMINSTKH